MECAKPSEKELETLREENALVKKKLASLQHEFTKLQEYVKELEKKKASEKEEESMEEKKENNLSQFQVAINLLENVLMEGEINRRKLNLRCEKRKATLQMLVERCNSLEKANAQLQVDSQIQRQQYEKCLDKVASQVVQAILVQKTQQEQCERLSKKVEVLQKQNVTLSTFIASKGKFQSLNHCRKGRLLPIALADSNSNSQSLPNTLIKSKADCDTSKLSEVDNSGCWYNNNAENSSTSHSDTPLRNSRTSSDLPNQGLPPHGFSSLPQSRSSKKRSLRNQSSADGCWYDIIKSLHKGDPQHLNVPHSIVDNHNLSSDSSSVDTEEQSLDSQRRTIPCTEDTISTSSSGDDFHSSFPTSRNQQQGETSLSFPSSTASNTSALHNTECRLVASSQCPNPKSVSTVERRNPDITLDFVPQSSNYQNIVVNFSHTNASPDLSNKGTNLPLTCTTTQSNTVSSCGSTLSSPIDKNKNGNPSAIERVNGNETEPKTTDVIVKDEGYSTMSSDVQSEAKENIAVVTISTVEEERGKNFDGESETKESSPNGTLKNKSDSLDTLKVEKNNNKKNLSLGLVSLTIKDCESAKPEYSEGLRVIYDDDDNNSDILFVPISDEGDKYLRHSFNFPFPEEPIQLQRCSSDSYLYKLYVRFPSSSKISSKKLSTNQNTLQSLPLKNQSPNNLYNTYLRRAFRKESLKKGCLKLFNRPLVPKSNKEDIKKVSVDYDFLNQMYPSSLSHPRILSPSYSHAEMEDWSLDLSGEDITTPGGTEPSAAESSAPSHHQSHPSIQEATLDLEEDHHDFLWNGATYFKADENDLVWPYDKNQSKGWDLNLMTNKQCRSMISPKSGCSDQPAIWSSSEQLSCCSDIASKCSTDIENFCEQLCNLPELKRVSVCSSENGGNESLPSNPKLSEVDSNEDNSEIIDDINVETVFTRDFYRLVKFESTRSLTASCKSLATSEGFLTLEKLKGLESIHNSKTLASVLGFIAEQQKYCKDREVMDENASFGPLVNKHGDKDQNKEASFHIQIREDSQSNNEMENIPEARNVQDNVLTSSESLSCLDLNSEFRSSFATSRQSTNPPPKPKRSTSLNLGVRANRSYRSRGTLPPLPSSYSPPPIPSRTTSRSTLPHHNVFRACKEATMEIPEEPFPPPPPLEDSYVEPYHAIPMAPPPPKVPPHRIKIPNIPKRSSSMTYNTIAASESESPPVPKRITSRALPTPPPVNIPPRSTSLEGGGSASCGNTQSLTSCSGKASRPKSLLKEATVSNAMNKTQGRQRGSCGDLAPLCRNSATLMLELQKMAKAEEDEKVSSGFYSPEATSPGTEVGLGTGWVRIEPASDLGDPQTRANLLDTMLQSSEGCSSETDEDLAKHLQHTELLKAVQRNRRKRKASRHNESDPLKVVGWGHPTQRPSILGRRHSLFNRFGEEEESALREFQFLESFPSQSDISNVGDHLSRPSAPHNARPAVPEVKQSSSCSSPLGGGFCVQTPYVRLTKDLKNLRSSEPCPDIPDYPLSSIPTFASRSSVESSNPPPISHSRNRRNESSLPVERSQDVDLSNSDRTCLSVKNDLSFYPSLESNINSKETKFSKNVFPSFEKISNVHSSGTSDNKFHYRDVPSSRPDENRFSGINSSNDLYSSNIRQSNERENPLNFEMKHRVTHSKIPLKNEPEVSKGEIDTSKSPSAKENNEDELIDTRSLNNVKSIIQKLNSRNQTSGKLKTNSGNTRKNFNPELKSVSNPYSKPVPLSTKNAVDKDSDPVTENLTNVSSVNKCSSNDQKYASISKRTPKLPGSNLIKRLTANSPQPKEACASSLPPKGSALTRQTIQIKPPSKPNVLGKGLRSPRLPRFKMGNSRPDPLAAFSGKGMCDSGSSEGSEKGCGRLSISDSCAEIFSPGESGDEVFHKNACS